MDVFILVATKDIWNLSTCIQTLKQNSLTTIGTIIVVTNDDDLLKKPTHGDYVVYHESMYPFQLNDIRKQLIEMGSKHEHASWYYQQLLKLYIFEVFPTLSNHTLIVDSDIQFKNSISFIENGKPLLSYGYPLNWGKESSDIADIVHSHVKHGHQFIPGWKLTSTWSGMHHHIVMTKEILKDIFLKVEQHHSKPLWQAFIDNLDITKWNAAGEYVLYFHHACLLFPDDIVTRHITSCDIIYDTACPSIVSDNFYTLHGFHRFTNFKTRIHTMDYIPRHLTEKIVANIRDQTEYLMLMLNEHGNLCIQLHPERIDIL